MGERRELFLKKENTRTVLGSNVMREKMGCLVKAATLGMGVGVLFVGGLIVWEKMTQFNSRERYGVGYNQPLPY